ncbi:MAG: ABC transporter substrate-binding protein, partial [Deltaproteobacteria bacterium]|nr:ABC transporter substrate-binding protein [Deltaproteobacteria bacterium]
MVSMTRTTPRFHLWIFLFLILAGEFVEASSYPVRINDSTGAPIAIGGPPQRVICLVPGITEILFELGCGDAIKGLTAYETYPPETADKEVVGGFLSPSITRIEALNPDVIFLSSLHQDIRDRFAGDPCLLIQLESHSVEEIFGTVETLGKIFSREEKA